MSVGLDMTPAPEPFEADRWMTAALDRHGGAGRFDPSATEPLRVVCDALEDTAGLTAAGRWATQRYLGRLLDQHLAISERVAADPGVADEQIVAPVFVIGAPRTGTTALHRLLAAAPEHRVPLGWEFLYPVGPPAGGHDDRIELAAAELTFPQTVRTGLRAIHTYSAEMPKECLSAMAFSFRTEEFISRYHVPAYVEWLASADMTPAYQMHRRVLQVLQRGADDRRWVVKSPVHLQAIPELVATYPDASFVVTHRDPADVLASVSSLIATLRSAFSDDVDAVAIGRYHLDLYGRSLTRLVDHVDGGALPSDRTMHVAHSDIVARPLEVLERVHAAIGYAPTPAAQTAAAEVVAEERDDAAGAHHYRAEDFGLDAEEIDDVFSTYRDRFLGGP